MILNRLNSENPVLCRKVKNLRALHECVMALPRETAIKVTELALTGHGIAGSVYPLKGMEVHYNG